MKILTTEQSACSLWSEEKPQHSWNLQGYQEVGVWPVEEKKQVKTDLFHTEFGSLTISLFMNYYEFQRHSIYSFLSKFCLTKTQHIGNTPVYGCVRHFKQTQWPWGHVFMRKLRLRPCKLWWHHCLRAAFCGHIIICMGAILIYA